MGILSLWLPIGMLIEGKPVMGATISGCVHNSASTRCTSNIASSARIARSLFATGVRKSDVFQNMAGYGLFTGGMGFHYGGEKLGVLMVPTSTGNSKRQIRLMLEFGTTLVHFMASYGIYLLNVFKEMGIDPKRDTKLKYAV